MATAISDAIKDAQALIQHLESLDTLPFGEVDRPVLLRGEAGKLDALLQAARTTINSIENNFAEINKVRNFGIPRINEVPLELLINILELAVDGRDRLKNIQRLTTVCKYWRQVIMKTPPFWARVDYCRSPRGLVRRAIALSSPLPVDLTYSGPPPGSSRSHSIQTFWEDLLLVMGRCRALHLQVGGMSDVQCLVGYSAPALEELSIEADPPLQMEGPLLDWFPMIGAVQGESHVNLFGGDAPRLRDISFSGAVRVSWQSPLLSGLRELKIENMGSASPSLPALLATLRRSPELVVLHLDLLGGVEDISEEGSELVHLPALRSLKLGRLTETPAQFLLSHLRPWRRDFFSVTLASQIPAPTTIALVLEHLLQAIQSVAKAGYGTIKLIFSPSQQNLALSATAAIFDGGGNYEILLVLSPAMIVGALHQILGTLLSPLSNYEIHVDHGDESDQGGARCISCLPYLPNVSNLALHCTNSLHELLTYLTSPHIVNGTKRWAVPELKVLFCGYGSGAHLEALLEMVRSRYSEIDIEPASSTTRTIEQRPAPLDKLTIYAREYDRDVWAGIGNLIGKDRIEVLPPLQ